MNRGRTARRRYRSHFRDAATGGHRHSLFDAPTNSRDVAVGAARCCWCCHIGTDTSSLIPMFDRAQYDGVVTMGESDDSFLFSYQKLIKIR